MEKVTYAIKCAKCVQGWMKERELQWLCERAQEMPTGAHWAELGSWKGRSLIATGICLPESSTLYAVEHCDGNAGKEQTTHFEARFCGWIRGHLTLASSLIAQENPTVDVEPILMKTSEAALHVPDRSLDCVFIDADHTYKGCKEDIQNWLPKLKHRGLLCGHDFGHAGVEKAVKEMLPGFGRGFGSIWYWENV